MLSFFLPVCCLVLMHSAASKTQRNELCRFTGTYSCGPLPRHILGKINLPPNACLIHACKNCIKAFHSFVVTTDFVLLSPSSFLLKHSDKEFDKNYSTAYECITPSGNTCECDEEEVCSGTDDFCTIRNCTTPAPCHCKFTYKRPRLLAITPDITLENPDMITIEICLFDKHAVTVPSILQRKLLEGEKALFTQNNFTVRFDDPVLHLPDIGRVIIRSPDFEHVLSVPQDFLIKIPFEFLAYKTNINIIYIHPSGRTVSGFLHVSGKSTCQLRQCFLCPDVFTHIKCLPTVVQYLIYSIFIVITMVTLMCLKFIFKFIIFIVRASILICIFVYKLCKIFARSSLLLGSFIGNFTRDTIFQAYRFLEINAERRANIATLPLVLLASCLIITLVHGDCNTHAIVRTDLKTCQRLQDNTKHCNIFTTAEFTLPTLSSETCLWFADTNNNHLFSLKIKLDSVSCKFHTDRMYFTFPVKAKHISQVSCIFNKYCGRGVHCIKRKVGRDGIHFESETAESRSYPGLSGCNPGSLGVGCAILTRAACNFFRTWYVPDLLQSYEVSKIRGHTCKYHISVEHTENNTVSKIVVSDSAFTSTGIKVTILGAYDQPQLHLNDFFIKRVGRPSEAYLAPASQRNHPKAGEIGAVQANVSYTNNFIFDPHLSQCDFFEDVLRCITAPDALENLRSSQEHALPLQRDIHLFQVKDGQLESTLLFSSAIRVQLYFSNFKISVQTTTICPQFGENEIQTTGCYNCPILARMKFTAHSTCEAGIVTVSFQELNIYTKAIKLSLDATEFIVKFSANKQCYNEKLCLKSATLIQCKAFQFCLSEPSVELLQLDTNYTRTLSSQTSSTWPDWFQFPNISTSLFILKSIGATLLIICLTITLFSTCITCCCHRK